MKLGCLWLVAILALGSIAAYLYYQREQEVPETTVQLRPHLPADEPAPVPRPEPQVQHPVQPPPVVPEEQPEPLPPLAESDTAAREGISRVLGEAAGRTVVSEDVIRRIVATVDNLPRERISMKVRAVPAVEGKFKTRGPEEQLVLDEANFERYRPFVEAIAAIDAAQASAIYKRFYPLLQQAYEELGYPEGYFNDRLVAVIDDLLAAPEVTGPIRLQHPGVLYTYADPDLERRSPGQKMLIRMGPQNAKVVKEKLRALRREIAE